MLGTRSFERTEVVSWSTTENEALPQNSANNDYEWRTLCQAENVVHTQPCGFLFSKGKQRAFLKSAWERILWLTKENAYNKLLSEGLLGAPPDVMHEATLLAMLAPLESDERMCWDSWCTSFCIQWIYLLAYLTWLFLNSWRTSQLPFSHNNMASFLF